MKRVRGIIVARKISEDLRLACSYVPTLGLYDYELSVLLKKVELEAQRLSRQPRLSPMELFTSSQEAQRRFAASERLRDTLIAPHVFD
jgi:hypothetical protein